MGIFFRSVFSTAAVLAIAALPATAQDFTTVDADNIDVNELYTIDDVYVYDIDVVTVPEGFNALFYNYSGDFYENRTIRRQFVFLTGGLRGRYADREIVWDANAVNEAYETHLELQTGTTPLIRVPDLPNPYTASLLTSPGYVGEAVITGSEFIYEFTPMP